MRQAAYLLRQLRVPHKATCLGAAVLIPHSRVLLSPQMKAVVRPLRTHLVHDCINEGLDARGRAEVAADVLDQIRMTPAPSQTQAFDAAWAVQCIERLLRDRRASSSDALTIAQVHVVPVRRPAVSRAQPSCRVCGTV